MSEITNEHHHNKMIEGFTKILEETVEIRRQNEKFWTT